MPTMTGRPGHNIACFQVRGVLGPIFLGFVVKAICWVEQRLSIVILGFKVGVLDSQNCLLPSWAVFEEETKGWFHKRAVLANVPSFRFWYRGTSECTFIPCFGTGEHPKVPSFRFLVLGNIRQNHPSGNHPFANPRVLGPFFVGF